MWSEDTSLGHTHYRTEFKEGNIGVVGNHVNTYCLGAALQRMIGTT